MDQGITLDGGGLSPLAREHAAGQSTGVQIPVYPAGAGNTSRADGINRINSVYPAGAGNTRQGTITEVRTTVYPRWRGEHTKHT
ncbi:hypothetical protein O5629_19100 [Escherichia coli]|nr:hypothetical protein [Escherichia coli]